VDPEPVLIGDVIDELLVLLLLRILDGSDDNGKEIAQ